MLHFVTTHRLTSMFSKQYDRDVFRKIFYGRWRSNSCWSTVDPSFGEFAVARHRFVLLKDMYFRSGWIVYRAPFDIHIWYMKLSRYCRQFVKPGRLISLSCKEFRVKAQETSVLVVPLSLLVLEVTCLCCSQLDGRLDSQFSVPMSRGVCLK
jgi:hypothetical protein